MFKILVRFIFFWCVIWMYYIFIKWGLCIRFYIQWFLIRFYIHWFFLRFYVQWFLFIYFLHNRIKWTFRVIFLNFYSSNLLLCSFNLVLWVAGPNNFGLGLLWLKSWNIGTSLTDLRFLFLFYYFTVPIHFLLLLTKYYSFL